MPVAVIIALIQAAVAMLPEAEQIIAAAQSIFNGTGTDTDVATLQAATTALNAQATAAEAAAGATGPGA